MRKRSTRFTSALLCQEMDVLGLTTYYFTTFMGVFLGHDKEHKVCCLAVDYYFHRFLFDRTVLSYTL
jgi:hypothetical protein